MTETSGKTGIPVYQVDAFADEPFKGNPAAVCILPKEYDDGTLQSVAAEMNLSETAFLLPLENKPIDELSRFSLRWFTPSVEVPLCGHATLATAAVLFHAIRISADELVFETKSGPLTARKDKKGLLLGFPVDKPVPSESPGDLLRAMGIINFTETAYAERLKIALLRLPTEADVRALSPDFERMESAATLNQVLGVAVTSEGEKPYDFVSRFFAPWAGIDEDPVTGAAHTVLAPYWSEKLGKPEMLAYQASSRGGKLTVRLAPNHRVDLIGNAVIVLKGELYL